MQPIDWSAIISASVVPVVTISACGLLCLAFYNRLAAIVTRLRTFQRERIQEEEWIQKHGASDRAADPTRDRHLRFLVVLEIQTARVTRRARLIRATLLCLLAAIACLVVSCLASGLSLPFPSLRALALGAFLLGLILMLAGVVFAMVEMWRALEPIQLEAEFVRQITRASTPADHEANHI